MIDNMGCSDRLALYRIDDEGNWTCEVKTNKKPSLWERALKRFGFYNCADDAMMEYALNDLALHLYDKYSFISVGESSASSTVYTLDDLVDPVMTRIAASTATTFTTNNTDSDYPDSVRFVSLFVSDSDYTLKESGLHTAESGGYMGARQTFGNWDVATGDSFGVIWDIICSRG